MTGPNGRASVGPAARSPARRRCLLEGVVYLLTDGPEGMLYRLEPRDGDEVAIK